MTDVVAPIPLLLKATGQAMERLFANQGLEFPSNMRLINEQQLLSYQTRLTNLGLWRVGLSIALLLLFVSFMSHRYKQNAML